MLRALPALAALPALVLSAASAAAQEPPPADTAHFQGGRVVRVAPVEVTAAGTPLARLPGAVHVLEASPVERAGALGAGELLRRAPGVHFQDEDGLGLHVNIGVRGLDPRRSSRVLLLEDGVPVHLAPYGDPTAHYQPPPDAVARVEVLKGSGQVLHGPQTVGGVVNYLRAAPPARPGTAGSLAGGSRGALLGRLEAGGTWGARAGLVSLGRRAVDGPRDGWRHEVHDLAARARVAGARPARTLQAGADDERSDWGETGLTQAEFEAAPFANPSPADVFALRRYAGRALHELRMGAATLRTTAYAQHVHRASWRQASSSADRFGSDEYAEDFACPGGAASAAECGNQGRPRTYRFAGVEPRLTVVHRLGGVEAVSDAGVRLHLEDVARRQRTGATPDARTGVLTRDNALRTGALAAFAQTRLTAGAGSLTPGVRLEHVRAENLNRIRGGREADRYTRLLPGIGAAWEAGAGTTLFAGVHRGFAPPRPADVLAPRPGEGLVQVEPETSWNFEVGARALPHPRLAVDAALFRIDFRNQVVEGSAARSGQRFVNAGATLHEGAEVALALDARPLFVEAAYTRVGRAEFRGDVASSVDGVTPVRGNRLPYAPRHLLAASAGVRAAGGAEARLGATHVSAQFGDDLNTVAPSADGQRGVIPAHTVWSLSGSLPLGRAGAALFVSARNLLDTVYVTGRQEGIMVGMPRTVLAGVRWGW